MANYSYIAVDCHGGEKRGVLEGATQMEAVRRVREMGLFPTKIKPRPENQFRMRSQAMPIRARKQQSLGLSFRMPRRVRPARLVIFTRQLATMLEAGMPLVRGL